jgi:hypothetical protein
MNLGPDPRPTVTDEHLRLAGFALAHALGSIDGGGTLCTLAFVEQDGARELVRYEADSIPESIVMARADLRTQLGSAGHAVLVYDGYATIDRVRHDALLVDLIVQGGTTVAGLLQRYWPGRFGPAALLRVLGVPIPGGLAIVGRPYSESTLPPDASIALTRGLADHPYGLRAYGLAQEDEPTRAD